MAILNFSNLDETTKENRTFDKGPKVLLKDGAQFTGKIFFLEERETKSGTGRYLSVGISIDNHNCTVFEILNIENQNEKAVEIALKNIRNILKFNGITSESFDSNDLMGLNVCVTLGVRTKYNSPDKENFVKFYNSFAGKTVNTEGQHVQAKMPSSTHSKAWGETKSEDEIPF